MKKVWKHFTNGLKKCVDYVDTHAYALLIMSLFLTMVLYPFIAEHPSSGFWIHLFMSLILITGFYTISNHTKFIYQSLFLGVFTLIFSRVDYAFFAHESVTLIYLFTGLFFFAYVTFNLIVSLHDDQKVNAHLILGVIAGYMLLGLMGAFVFSIIEILLPGSFTITIDAFNNFPQYIYFSFVNLTTLGYGDIIPLSAHAQSRSVLFTISGQMYLMILIGVIVGKYVRKGSEIL